MATLDHGESFRGLRYFIEERGEESKFGEAALSGARRREQLIMKAAGEEFLLVNRQEPEHCAKWS
ncbi:MAG: hypothetical protein ACYDA3_05600 [Gaiellaceae bacterium]